MTAHEELLGDLLASDRSTREEAEQRVDAYRNEIRHEAAEEQRAAIAEIMERWGGYLHQDMLTELIDVIDPKAQP